MIVGRFLNVPIFGPVSWCELHTVVPFDYFTSIIHMTIKENSEKIDIKAQFYKYQSTLTVADHFYISNQFILTSIFRNFYMAICTMSIK